MTHHTAGVIAAAIEAAKSTPSAIVGFLPECVPVSGMPSSLNDLSWDEPEDYVSVEDFYRPAAAQKKKCSRRPRTTLAFHMYSLTPTQGRASHHRGGDVYRCESRRCLTILSSQSYPERQ